MRAMILVSWVLLAGCSTSHFAERVPVVPPAAAPLAQQKLPVIQQPFLRVGPADSEATRAWLDSEIERNRYVSPPPPPPPPQVIEREVVYVRTPHFAHRNATFPWHTATMAGVGAVIGHQSGHGRQGAWIGGLLGLLQDIGHE